MILICSSSGSVGRRTAGTVTELAGTHQRDMVSLSTDEEDLRRDARLKGGMGRHRGLLDSREGCSASREVLRRSVEDLVAERGSVSPHI